MDSKKDKTNFCGWIRDLVWKKKKNQELGSRTNIPDPQHREEPKSLLYIEDKGSSWRR